MSGRQKLKRIGRLVDVRERERDGAQAELAAAKRATESALAAVQRAEESWNGEASKAAGAAPMAVHEFALQRMHLLTLRRAIDLARADHERAQTHEQAMLEAATAAQRELRKMEIWREAETERQRVERERVDQITTDEIAARGVHRPAPNR
jgi:flagellar export protein FliJ